MKENEKGWIGMDRDKKGWKIIKNMGKLMEKINGNEKKMIE